MSSLIRKIETVMATDPPTRLFSLETVLHGISIAYGGLTRLKAAVYALRPDKAKSLPCTVISIGNLTVGGTGKTPMTLYMARLVQSLGYRVAVISRGYKGGMEKTGGIVGNGCKPLVLPEEAGDEPFMIAQALRDIPVLVGKDRFSAGMKAISSFSPDVLILDDAFQHIRLRRNINLLLMDHTRPFGNRYLLPRGPLREPIRAISRADIIIETRIKPGSNPSPNLLSAIRRYAPRTPLFRARIEPVMDAFIPRETAMDATAFRLTSAEAAHTLLRGKRVFAFSGIADNKGFHDSLAELGCAIVGHAAFPDHHWFDTTEVTAIGHQAGGVNAELIVTTPKDRCRIHPSVKWPVDLAILGIEHDFGEHAPAFRALIKGKLNELTKKSGVNSCLTMCDDRVI